MSSRKVETVKSFKSAFDKALMSSCLKDEEERIMDILKSLHKFQMDIDTLRETDIGSTLKEARKKFADSEVGLEAKKLTLKWKKDCSEDAPQNPIKTDVVETSPLQSTPVNDAISEEWDDEQFSKLSVARKKVMCLLAEVLKLSCSDSNIAKFVAFEVESSINNLFAAETDAKSYLNKAKSLTFNFKNNEKLRNAVINGEISSDKLVTLSTKDLATDELRSAREETSKTATLARRGDIYELARDEIAKANNIDPNKGGEFVCSRCKGTKTSHYAMQTRSSDEPMTIFVCCLTCGKRWRC